MSFRSLPILALALLTLAWPSPALEEGGKVALRYTYKTDVLSVPVVEGAKGQVYLPLMDLSRFFGIQVDFEPQIRRVTLSKGKNKVKVVLSQPVYLSLAPEVSYPIDPLEVLSGQLSIPATSAEDLLGTLLGIPVHYLPDQGLLIAGGVTDKELQQEILADPGPSTSSSPQPASSAAAGPTPVESPAAAPSSQEAVAVLEEPTRSPTVEPLPLQPPRDQVEHVRRIIIDPGHGGYDAGAPGYDRRFHEKSATLDIAQQVAKFLREEQGLEVLMTRKEDRYITLKYRTDFAKSHNGDLFVSIHCNSNPRKGAHGTEIYKYGLRATSHAAAAAAARENFGGGDLDFIKQDLTAVRYKSRSQCLAEHVEMEIKEKLGQPFRNIQEAPFYVLAHAEMPAILIETAFISNKDEENKLRDPYWREKMAKAITAGILEYKDIVEGNLDDREARR
ncbi:MAG TPA: N-acetylmuramoyl-L-alanine amidase [bacterium]|nr:N-acetylmuramoyl-L-alanine amidase [bacterium]